MGAPCIVAYLVERVASVWRGSDWVVSDPWGKHGIGPSACEQYVIHLLSHRRDAMIRLPRDGTAVPGLVC